MTREEKIAESMIALCNIWDIDVCAVSKEMQRKVLTPAIDVHVAGMVGHGVLFCHRAGINTLGELAEWTEEALVEAKAGPKVIKAIKTCLDEHGLSLKPSK